MKLIENLFKEVFNFKNPIKNMMIKVYTLEPEDFLDEMFDLYKKNFRDSDVMSEFNIEKRKFIRDNKSDFIDKLDAYSDKKISMNEFIEWLQDISKPYLPFVEKTLYKRESSVKFKVNSKDLDGFIDDMAILGDKLNLEPEEDWEYPEMLEDNPATVLINSSKLLNSPTFKDIIKKYKLSK